MSVDVWSFDPISDSFEIAKNRLRPVISCCTPLVLFVLLVHPSTNQPSYEVRFGLLVLLHRLEGVIESVSYRDDRTSWIVSPFIVGDGNDEPQAQSKEYLRSCVDAASGA